MNKIIACLLALCLLVSVLAVGWLDAGRRATAEAAQTEETAPTVADEPEPSVETASSVEAEPSGETEASGETEPSAQDAEESDTAAQGDAGESGETGDADAPEALTGDESADGEGTSEAEAQTDEGTTDTAEGESDGTTDGSAGDESEQAAVAEAAAEAAAVEAPVVESDVGSGPAWVTEGAHRRYGELNDLLPIAMLNHLTVFLCSTAVLEANGYTVDELRAVSFGLDEVALGEDFCDGRAVIVSTLNPDARTKDGTVFVWVGRPSEVPSASEALGETLQINNDEDAILETEIMVRATDYTADAPCSPTFSLTAYPDLTEGMTFAVIQNDGEPQAISGSAYAPAASGVYRFAVLDAAGALKARSIAYDVTVASTPETGETEASGDAQDESPSASDAEGAGEETGDGTVTAGDETAEGETAGDETPEGETTGDEIAEGETAGDETAGDETAGDETAEGETAGDETAEGETAGDETAEGETSEGDGEETEPEPELLTQADVVMSVALAATLPEETEEAAPELTVRAYDYAEGTPTETTPFFELAGAPDEGGYYYGISINGSGVVRLRDATYAITKSGDYTLVFYLLDADGGVVDESSPYHAIVDYTLAASSNEAWMPVGETRVYGSLASLLRSASGGTVYLLTSGVIELTDASKLDSVSLAADPDLYGEGYGVVITDHNPDGESADGITYVWVGVDVSEMSLALFAAPLGATTFSVDSASIGSRSLADGLWVNGSDTVSFSITDSIPDNTYTYQVSVDGGPLVSFAGTLGGLSLSNGSTYTLQFQITDADDAANFVTVSYTIRYDNQAPALICKAGADYTLSYYAGDAVSGIAGDGSQNDVTFNATADPINWAAALSYYGQNVYTYSVQYKGEGTIAAGTLGVRDRANNVAVWGEDITITSGTGGSMSGTGASGVSGSAGSGGTASRTVYHSASTYTTVTAYNGVELVVETGEMNTLTIGDTELDLSLSREGDAQGDGMPGFRAAFLDWRGGGTETEDAEESDETVDTLVLTAADASEADGTYHWTFDGSVYKKLAASGIDYLVLSVGDNATALSTAGFAAGIRYNMYRAAGLVSSAFIYTVSMDASGQVQIQVTVGGETYALSGDQTSEFYYYDVYSGSLDMLSQPFGQGNVQNSAAQGRQG